MPTPQPTKKRHRATPSQLAVLESHFRVDPSPTPETREEISRRIDMNEKSIHIWFQNRRAKEKFLRRQGRQSSPRDVNPTSVRRATPTRPTTTSGSPESSTSPPSTTSAITPPDASYTLPALTQISFTATTLDIGTWHRILTPGRDGCVANVTNKTIEYLIVEGTSKFKLSFPISNIAAIVLDTTCGTTVYRGSSYCAVLAFTLLKPPMCFMEVPNSSRDAMVWSATNDFTEAQQSSTILVHTLTGPLPQLASDTRFLLEMEPSLKTRFLERSGRSLPAQPSLSAFPSIPYPTEFQTANSYDPSRINPIISPAGNSVQLANPLLTSEPPNTLPTTNPVFTTMSPNFTSYYTSPANIAVTMPGGQLYIPPPPPAAIYPTGSGEYLRPPSMYTVGDTGSFSPPPSLYASSASTLSFLPQSMEHELGSPYNSHVGTALTAPMMPYVTTGIAMGSYDAPKMDSLYATEGNRALFNTTAPGGNASGFTQTSFNP